MWFSSSGNRSPRNLFISDTSSIIVAAASHSTASRPPVAFLRTVRPCHDFDAALHPGSSMDRFLRRFIVRRMDGRMRVGSSPSLCVGIPSTKDEISLGIRHWGMRFARCRRVSRPRWCSSRLSVRSSLPRCSSWAVSLTVCSGRGSATASCARHCQYDSGGPLFPSTTRGARIQPGIVNWGAWLRPFGYPDNGCGSVLTVSTGFSGG